MAPAEPPLMPPDRPPSDRPSPDRPSLDGPPPAPPGANNLDFQPLPQSEQPEKSWGMRLFLLFLFAVGAATAGWYGLNEFNAQTPKEIPVVRADPAPVKVRPERPGGIEIPNQDKKVYDLIQGKGKGEGDQPESLLPPPESPLPPPKPAKAPTPKPAAKASTPKAAAPVPPASAPPAQAPAKAVPTPKVPVATKAPPPPAPPPAPKPAPAKVAPAPKAPAPAAVPPQLTTPTQQEVVAAKPPPALPKAPVPKAKARQTLSGQSTTQIAKVTAGSVYSIQLAAVRSQFRAKEEWGRLSKKHTDLLGKLQLNVVKADLGAKKGIFYRLRAGPILTEAAAKTLCSEFGKRKVGCLVVRPGR